MDTNEVPSWATSMVRNYRAAFKEKHGRDTTITDAAIWNICNTVYHDADTDVESGLRVDAMLEAEQANG